ncbi:hypothetical protein [Dactylosporangium sp. NPDC051484]|uniref:hypothetical protein n=1 Tax=Dactylosporangium sp. NPDC051484 TaxID=3154942 RepID=UPI00344FB5C0
MNAVAARSEELQTRLASAEAKLLDPAGYKLIKQCVNDQALAERGLREILADREKFNLSHRTISMVAIDPATGAVSTTCTAAEPYLK